MTFSKMSSTLIFLVILASILSAYAQDSPQDFVDAHNAARNAIYVGNMTWDTKVAAYAQNYVNKLAAGDCMLRHSSSPYGENLAWGPGDLTGVVAVKLWVDEKANCTCGSKLCITFDGCGHYGAVVWPDAIRLGCAKVTCDNNRGSIVSCNYATRTAP